MEENMLNSNISGMKRSSSLSLLHVNKDIGELVWENGEVKVHGGEAAVAAVEERPAKLDNRLYCTSNLDQSKKQIQQGFSTFKLNHNNVVGKVNSNSNGKQLCTYSSFNSTLSPQCKKPRIIDSSGSSQAIAKSHTLQYLGSNNNNNQRTSLGGGGRMINFPNFLIPALFLNKSSSSSSAAAAAAAAATSSKGHDHSSVVIDSSNNNKSATQELKERPFQQVQVQPLDQYSHAQQLYHGASSSSAAAPPPPPPNNSKRNNNNEQHLVASSPVCSIGASNDPIMKKQHEEYTNITDHDDTTTYISDDDDEETEDVIAKETPAAAGTRAKRIRDPEIHNLSEKKRRDKINKRIRTLKELIPNCNKVDKASTLDDAIDYLKTLKLQLQIMSMGSGLCMPVMMLPNHQNQLMGGGTGMCYRPSGTGNPQFHIPHDSTTLIQNMFGGFFNQMRPMIMPPSPPFINPITGNPSITPPLAPMSITNSSTLEVSNVQAIKPEYATNNNQVSLHQHGTSSSYPFYFPTIINQEENNKEGNRR